MTPATVDTEIEFPSCCAAIAEKRVVEPDGFRNMDRTNFPKSEEVERYM
jgi:hypothetical protein